MADFVSQYTAAQIESGIGTALQVPTLLDEKADASTVNSALAGKEAVGQLTVDGVTYDVVIGASGEAGKITLVIEE